MGHIRLGNLPKTHRWIQVISLLGGAEGSANVVAATLEAARKGLENANKDPALVHSFWLLTQIPIAARKDNFSEELRKIGLSVPDKPTLTDIISAFSTEVDEHVNKQGGRTDFGEIAQLALTESLTALGSERTQSLFETKPEDVQKGLAGFATTKEFGILARDSFSRLIRRYLIYFISMEISNLVGGGQRFSNIDEHTEFLNAVEVHCRQASRIVEEFAGGWFSKANYEGGITPEKVSRFLFVALKKIREELARRGQLGEE